MSDCRFDVSPVNYPDPDPDDFGSLIAFASQLIFVLHDNLTPSHDCLNSIGINRMCAKKSKAGNERTCVSQ